MSRSTKIVATLGPASSEPLVLERMLVAGVERRALQFLAWNGGRSSRARRSWYVKPLPSSAGTLRSWPTSRGRNTPELKISKAGKATFPRARKKFVLDASTALGTDDRVGLDYKDLPREVKWVTPCCSVTA